MAPSSAIWLALIIALAMGGMAEVRLVTGQGLPAASLAVRKVVGKASELRAAVASASIITIKEGSVMELQQPLYLNKSVTIESGGVGNNVPTATIKCSPLLQAAFVVGLNGSLSIRGLAFEGCTSVLQSDVVISGEVAGSVATVITFSACTFGQHVAPGFGTSDKVNRQT